MEEGVGFEPTDGCPPLVFKTSRFSRSRNLPNLLLAVSVPRLGGHLILPLINSIQLRVRCSLLNHQ